MAPKPSLDAANISAVITTKWNGGPYTPLTVTSVEGYTIETNMDEDSDPFNIVIGDRFGEFAEMLGRDNEVRIQIFGIGEGINYLLTGIVDTVVYSDDGVFVLSGRDRSCIATDTLAEPITYRQVRASDIIAQDASQLKVATRLDLTPTNLLGKVSTDGSETKWEFWYRYIRRASQYMWLEPDGTLKSGPLNYQLDPTYFFGDPIKGSDPAKWIPVETGEIHSTKQGRVFTPILYYHNGSRILPLGDIHDTTIGDWLRRPTKIYERKDIVHPRAATHFVREEIYESKVGVQEIKIVVPDPGVIIRQNSVCQINVPELQLGGTWFIVGTRIIADSTGFTQEVRLREVGFALSRRVPEDPPTSQEPGKDTTDNLAGVLDVRWSQCFVDAANQWHGGHEFEWFLACLLGICQQETNFKNERALGGGTNDGFATAPGVRGIDYFVWDKTVQGPQNGVHNFQEWQTSFGNEPGAYVDFRLAVGPMQLYDNDFKVEADQVGGGKVSELYGNRWEPCANIYIGAKALHDKAVIHHVDNGPNENILAALSAYGGSDAYGNNVYAKALVWYDQVKEAFSAASAQTKADADAAVQAVQGSVQDIAKSILDYHKQGKYRDDNGSELPQIQAMADGQRIDTPSCPQLGKIQLGSRTLGAVKLLLDNGFLVGTFALASDHTHLGCGSRHSSGNAVDVSSVGTHETGFMAVSGGGAACKRVVMQVMNLFRAQKRGVLKPNQMICNGVGGNVDPQIQSLQLNGYEDDNYVDGDHTDHVHVGY